MLKKVKKMRMVARLGDKHGGHQCFPPTPAISGSGNVKVNGRPCLTVGSRFVPHACVKPHPVVSASGSRSVLVNGKPMTRVGDRTACGAMVVTGSSNVFAGG